MLQLSSVTSVTKFVEFGGGHNQDLVQKTGGVDEGGGGMVCLNTLTDSCGGMS